MVKKRSKAVALCLVFFSAGLLNKNENLNAAEKFNRNQTMLLNLKNAPESSGYYLVQSFRASKVIANDLEKALSQLNAVDQSYAKYRRRPDDRFLRSTALKITLAKQTAKELQLQLGDAYAELKSNVEDALITDENFPSDQDIKKKPDHKDMPGKIKDFLL